jgi:CBS-domain-containing membrane protein
MSREVVSCRPDQTLATAHRTMREHRIRRLPVIDAEARLLGLVSLDGLARHAAGDRGTQAVTRQREVTRTLGAIAAVAAAADEASAPATKSAAAEA